MERAADSRDLADENPESRDSDEQDQLSGETGEQTGQQIDNELDLLPAEPDREEQQYFEQQDVEFPDDLGLDPHQPQPDEQEEDQLAASDNFINSVIQEQQEFIQVLEQAENQLMLDENFILVISDVCNRKTDDFYFYDYRDSQLVDMVPSAH